MNEYFLQQIGGVIIVIEIVLVWTLAIESGIVTDWIFGRPILGKKKLEKQLEKT